MGLTISVPPVRTPEGGATGRFAFLPRFVGEWRYRGRVGKRLSGACGRLWMPSPCGAFRVLPGRGARLQTYERGLQVTEPWGISPPSGESGPVLYWSVGVVHDGSESRKLTRLGVVSRRDAAAPAAVAELHRLEAAVRRLHLQPVRAEGRAAVLPHQVRIELVTDGDPAIGAQSQAEGGAASMPRAEIGG